MNLAAITLPAKTRQFCPSPPLFLNEGCAELLSEAQIQHTTQIGLTPVNGQSQSPKSPLSGGLGGVGGASPDKSGLRNLPLRLH